MVAQGLLRRGGYLSQATGWSEGVRHLWACRGLEWGLGRGVLGGFKRAAGLSQGSSSAHPIPRSILSLCGQVSWQGGQGPEGGEDHVGGACAHPPGVTSP